MKWRKEPKRTVKDRSGFLFFPKTINGETRWLEWAKWTEHYHASMHGGGWWYVGSWVDSE